MKHWAVCRLAIGNITNTLSNQVRIVESAMLCFITSSAYRHVGDGDCEGVIEHWIPLVIRQPSSSLQPDTFTSKTLPFLVKDIRFLIVWVFFFPFLTALTARHWGHWIEIPSFHQTYCHQWSSQYEFHHVFFYKFSPTRPTHKGAPYTVPHILLSLSAYIIGVYANALAIPGSSYEFSIVAYQPRFEWTDKPKK